MDVITIKATKEQKEELKKIVRVLGYETMSEWLRAFIRENKVLTSKEKSV